MIITCAKTNLPIMGGPGWDGHPLSRVMLLLDGRPPLAGWYDGAGRIGCIDIRAEGIDGRIRSGTACLVLADRYEAGDTPRSLGRSHFDLAPGRSLDKEFVTACERLGVFVTYEGFLLARSGKVSPELGAALTEGGVAALERVGGELRQALARRLASLSCTGGSQTPGEVESLLAPLITLDVVPMDARGDRLCVVGGAGLVAAGGSPAVLSGGEGAANPLTDEVAGELLASFPPRKVASAVLTRDEEPVGAVALYESPEIGIGFHVLWTHEDVRIFGRAEDAVHGLGLPEEQSDDLSRTLHSLQSGIDLTIPLSFSNEPRP